MVSDGHIYWDSRYLVTRMSERHINGKNILLTDDFILHVYASITRICVVLNFFFIFHNYLAHMLTTLINHSWWYSYLLHYYIKQNHTTIFSTCLDIIPELNFMGLFEKQCLIEKRAWVNIYHRYIMCDAVILIYHKFRFNSAEDE